MKIMSVLRAYLIDKTLIALACMKTLKIFLKLCDLNLKKLLVFRTSFYISFVLMSVWVLAYIVLIEVIFYHTSSLAGWNKGQVLLIMAMYYLVQNCADIFFKDNFEDFGEMIRKGELDFKIVKPAPVRLLAFFWQIRFDHVAGLIVTCGLFYYALRSMQFQIDPAFFLISLLFVGVSLVLYFSILSCIATLTFWVQRNETFNVLIFNVSQLSRYPRQIYRHLIGKILTFALPLALISSVPAEIALQFRNSPLPLYFIIITIVFYIAGRLFWNYGLKKYTSAN